MNNAAPLAGFAIRFFSDNVFKSGRCFVAFLWGIKIFHFVLTDIFIFRRNFFLLCSSIIACFDFQIPRRNNQSFYSIKLLAASPF
jgi:hypothetical protein